MNDYCSSCLSAAILSLCIISLIFTSLFIYLLIISFLFVFSFYLHAKSFSKAALQHVLEKTMLHSISGSRQDRVDMGEQHAGKTVEAWTQYDIDGNDCRNSVLK